MTDKRNVYLDIIRAFACIGVVIFHYTQRFEELYHLTPDWRIRFTHGRMVVAVFFILSGYLSVVKDKRGISPLSYVKNKVLRLYPTYWVCVVLTFAFTSLFLKDRAVSVSDMLVDLTMLQSFVGAGMVDGAYWTLANELVFYVFILLTVVILKKYNKLPVFFMFWLIILFAVSLFKDDMPFLEKFEKFIACPYAHMFIAGSCIHFVQSDLKVNRVFSVVDMALSVLYQFVMFERVQAFFFVFATVLTALCVYADKKHFKINKNAAFIVRMLCFVASLSYPMYLLHQNLGYIIMKALIDKGFGSELIIFVPMIVIGTVSYVIHIFVEKRFIHGLGLV